MARRGMEWILTRLRYRLICTVRYSNPKPNQKTVPPWRRARLVYQIVLITAISIQFNQDRIMNHNPFGLPNGLLLQKTFNNLTPTKFRKSLFLYVVLHLPKGYCAKFGCEKMGRRFRNRLCSRRKRAVTSDSIIAHPSCLSPHINHHFLFYHALLEKISCSYRSTCP
jgi:hypothetical protein